VAQHRDHTTGEPRDWRETEAQPDDRLKEAVSDRLSDDDRLDPSGIGIHADAGEITLSGFVNSPEQRAAAEAAAQSVEGVDTVVNELRVRGHETGDQIGRD
jgi:osmotically-inducible protein OsmY